MEYRGATGPVQLEPAIRPNRDTRLSPPSSPYSTMATTAPAIQTLSPTAVRLVGLEPQHQATLQQFASWNGEGECPVTNQEVGDLIAHCSSHNLLDIYNKNSTTALQLGALQGKYNKLRNEYREVQTDVTDLTARVTQQKADIERLQRALDTAQRLLPTDGTVPNLGKAQDIGAPDPFSGNRGEYQTFKAQLSSKLAGDAHKFRSEQHRLQYMANLLRGNAYKMVLPYIQRDRIDLATTDELWEVLDGAYEDPDRKGTAKRELENLKQANREFSVYFADFQRLMAELRWDDDARKTALYRGLSEEMKDLLLSYSPPEEWNQYTHLLQELDSKIRARSAEKKRKGPTSITRPNPAPAPQPNPAPVIPVSQRTTANPEWHGPAPMDLSAGHREAERQRQYAERRAAGLCTSCGLPGHFRAECPRRKRASGGTPVRASEAQTRLLITDGTPEDQDGDAPLPAEN